MSEFVSLASASGVECIHLSEPSINSPTARFFVGSGKVEELARLVHDDELDIAIFNCELSPSQERDLEAALKCRVIGRTGLILDIFAQRARSHEGKLQVELAQLEHMSTRLVRGWTHLERQKGGVGLRGPGETQLETDRRLLRERIATLKRRLGAVKKQRETSRKSRQRAEVKTVSLVGYTNAGKSSLFNVVTHSGVFAKDMLFATLDPTVRRLKLGGGREIVLVDTVGFVRDLPHELVAAFHATLQETAEADVLVHVIDGADPLWREREQSVLEVLALLELDDRQVIRAFNKIDLIDLESGIRERDDGGFDVLCSAHSGDGLNDLLEVIEGVSLGSRLEGPLTIEPAEYALRAHLYEMGAVRDEHVDESGNTVLDVSIDRTVWQRISKGRLFPGDHTPIEDWEAQ